jgi:hypothetical protein
MTDRAKILCVVCRKKMKRPRFMVTFPDVPKFGPWVGRVNPVHIKCARRAFPTAFIGAR